MWYRSLDGEGFGMVFLYVGGVCLYPTEITVLLLGLRSFKPEQGFRTYTENDFENFWMSVGIRISSEIFHSVRD